MKNQNKKGGKVKMSGTLTRSHKPKVTPMIL